MTALGRHWPVAEWLVARAGRHPRRRPGGAAPALARRASRTAPITWSPSSPRPSTSCAPPAPATRRPCCARCCRPLWSARSSRATRRSPGRSPAATPTPSPGICGRSTSTHPAQQHLYREMARATAGRLDEPAPELWPVLDGHSRPCPRPQHPTPEGCEPARPRAASGMTALDSRLAQSRSDAADQLPVAQTREELAAERAKLRGPVAVVMTMGALHDGHAALIREAATFGSVLVTIFVNPLQFGAGEDLDRYPRTLGADLELCARAGASLVFAPTPDVVYPGRPAAGADRPGPGRADPRGSQPAGPLRRGAHRRPQAAQPDPRRPFATSARRTSSSSRSSSGWSPTSTCR